MGGDFAIRAGLKTPLQLAAQQHQQHVADALGPIVSSTLLSSGMGRAIQFPTIDTTSLLASMRIPPIDTTSLLPAMRFPTIDTTSLLERMRIPPIDLGLRLNGAVDLTGLMQSVVTGNDVLRGWERGAFRAKAGLQLPGFDEAVRKFTTEAAERVEIDLVLPDEPLVYAQQGPRDLLPDQWSQQFSDALARRAPTAFLAAGEVAKAIRYYGAFFLFLGLLQGGGVLEGGPLPDWAVAVIAAFAAGDTARRIAPRQ